MNSLVLRLDVSGRPLEWISKGRAVLLCCRDKVAWEAGLPPLRVRGGYSRASGQQSFVDSNTIIAQRGVSRPATHTRDTPPLTNARLSNRYACLCMYCGIQLAPCQLTRDHVIPVSRGGRDIWENVVSACRQCNLKKGNRTLLEAEAIGMRLLAVPYRPNRAEELILANRRILTDQMVLLAALIGRDSRFPAVVRA